MIRGVILVDFDNYGNFGSLGPSAPKKHHLEQTVNQLVSSLVRWNNSRAARAKELAIRLYGGWHGGALIDYTDRYCMVQTVARDFQKVCENCRVRFELVESIAAMPDKFFLNTVRTVPLYKKIELSSVVKDKCKNPEECERMRGLQAAKDGCPEPCRIRPRDLFSIVEQKTVDTNIVIDIAHYSHTDEYDFIGVVSGDYDLIPGVLYAESCSKNVILFRDKESLFFDRMMEQCEIQSGYMARYK